MLTFHRVRQIGLALPGVEESTNYGAPALKVKGKVIACIPVNKSAEPDSLAIRIDREQRAALLAEAPDTYYLPDHYESSPIVLVRMSRINAEEIQDLLAAAWRFQTKSPTSRAVAAKPAAGQSAKGKGRSAPPKPARRRSPAGESK